MIRSPVCIALLPSLVLAACSSSEGASGPPDWPTRPTRRYEATVNGVTLSVEAPEGLAGGENDNRGGNTSIDYWLANKTHRPPVVGITVSDDVRQIKDDVMVRMGRESNSLVRTAT